MSAQAIAVDQLMHLIEMWTDASKISERSGNFFDKIAAAGAVSVLELLTKDIYEALGDDK